MPCHDPIDPNFERAAQVTDMLCALLYRIDGKGGGTEAIEAVPGLRKWWEIHKAQDALERAQKG